MRREADVNMVPGRKEKKPSNKKAETELQRVKEPFLQMDKE